jgi:hypothetical protein
MAVQKDCIKGPNPALSKGEGKESNNWLFYIVFSFMHIEPNKVGKILIN